MKAKIGDILECECGIGTLVACTKQWAILRDKNGEEMAVYLKDNWISFPAEIDIEKTETQEIEIG